MSNLAAINLIEIITTSHPYRFCANTENFVYNSITYTPLSFETNIISQPQQGFSNFSISLPNFKLPNSTYLGDTVELKKAEFLGATLTHRVVQGTLLWHESNFTITGLTVTADNISISAGTRNIYQTSFFKHRYSSATTPGLY